MATKVATRLEAFFKNRVEDSLRSIVVYDEAESNITYLREGVAEQYTDDEIDRAITESRLEAVGEPLYGDLYGDDHGDLRCMIKAYENVIEINFVLGEGVGTVVAVDAEALASVSDLIDDAQELVAEERLA